MAQQLGGDVSAADRAALLAKADLGSNMVGEFPELQGIMGAYYAAGDGEPASGRGAAHPVPQPLRRPVNADTLTAATLFIAERAETLVGIWAIGLAPTGERDPFGLAPRRAGPDQRLRAARRRLAEDQPGRPAVAGRPARPGRWHLPCRQDPADTLAEVRAFIYERYRNQLIADSDRNAVEAVIALTPPLHQVGERVQPWPPSRRCPKPPAWPPPTSASATCSRRPRAIGQVNDAALVEPAEKALAASVATLRPQAEAQFATGDFAASLRTLAQAREPVDAFFADVMVMAEDPAVRVNRLALLGQLHGLMNQVADISRLAQ